MPIVYSPKEPKDNHPSTNAMTTCATVMTDHTQRIGKLLPYIASMKKRRMSQLPHGDDQHTHIQSNKGYFYSRRSSLIE
ncbi:hypothetical protein RMCBS344292_18102 [Rhizopus microsporus]|nr:hypothetical protein RMCBS344292_18102 [Rhizopus microsporus]